MVLLLAILDVWYCFDKPAANFDVRAISTAMCAIQAFLTHISFAMHNERINESMKRLKEVIQKRELSFFLTFR